ncbi:MAG: hypothetical protein LBU81_05110 [Methanosarcinales archaeon]|nr:hypothetical protein [Methanosarcinales archaeon]
MSGTGTSEDPFVLTTVEDLSLIKDNMTANYSLGNDIALTTYWTIPKTNLMGSEIFKGTLDGNNYTISNFRIMNNQDYVGFFSKTDGATIKNLKLTDVQITGTGSHVASISGKSNNTTIDNVHATTKANQVGAISGLNNVSGLIAQTGGLVLISEPGTTTIKNSSFTGTIQSTGTNGANGGIVGNINTGSSVTNCTFNGRINAFGTSGGIAGMNQGGEIKQSAAKGEVTTLAYSGGIVGSQNIRSGVNPVIEECYTDIAVSGSSGAGGIAGIAVGNIKNCFTIGSAYSSNVAAGITGFGGNITIENCYTTSTVYGAAAAGIGYMIYGTNTITNTYALNEYVTGLEEAYRISNSGTMTDSYSWEYITNNGTQMEIEGTEISKETFWDTFSNENTFWSAWSDEIWALNMNENFLLPVLKIQEDVDADYAFDYQPDEPTIIYKTVEVGGGGSGTVTIRETETVYVDSGNGSGSNGAQVVMGSDDTGNVSINDPATGFGNEFGSGFNWWIVISGLLFVMLVVAWFYIRKYQEELNEIKI